MKDFFYDWITCILLPFLSVIIKSLKKSRTSFLGDNVMLKSIKNIVCGLSRFLYGCVNLLDFV